jgi:hypothetical protein
LKPIKIEEVMAYRAFIPGKSTTPLENKNTW